MEAQSAITKLYIRRYLKMKKIMTAALGLSLLSGAAVFAAQNTSTAGTAGTDSGSMKSTKKSKHHKKSSGDTMSSTASSTTK